ncbi:MAG: hypothetical protein WD734_02425 [Dehalococcoidia bacterium]
MGRTTSATGFDAIRDALVALSRQALREPVLVAGAALGFALAAVAAVVMLVRGPTIGVEGHVDRAMTFNFALGLYYLTLAVLVPLAQMGPRLHRAWTVTVAALLPLFYGIENVQVYRGIDPRFTEVGSTLDLAIGGLFGVTALLQIVLFGTLAVRWFRRPVEERDRLLLVGVRYGAAAALVAFTAGIGMSVLSGSAVGDRGDLLLVHALGFHALQAAPLVGWLSSGEARRPGTARRVHVAGIAWLVATLAVGYQAATGQASFDLAPANVVAVLGLTVWAGVAVDAARARFTSPPAAPAPSGATP